jgi:cellulose 1,4-beta-cellobiosidase
MQFIGGYANIDGWNATSANSGNGNYGACCSEMDIWEANSYAEAYTPHPCSGTAGTGLARTACASGACGAGGVCDPAGCDFNSYRMGDQTFLGPGKTIDTTKKITVVTQFISSDGTDAGDLVEIRRKYVQSKHRGQLLPSRRLIRAHFSDGVVYNNSMSDIPSLSTQFNSLTDKTCAAQKTVCLCALGAISTLMFS